MREFLAKSNPIETIQSHTDKLIENYERIKAINPNLIPNWDLLYTACLYHDMGKINQKFQDKLRGKKEKGEIPHGVLSLLFLPIKELRERFSQDEIKILANAIGYHHDRAMEFGMEEIGKEREKLQKIVEEFKYNKLETIGINLKFPSAKYFYPGNRIYRKDERRKSGKECGEIFKNYVMIKGILNRIDYASSAGIEVEKRNNFLNQKLKEMMEEWERRDKNSSWNELQRYMMEHGENNLAVIAQTGMGKTEAGLLWIGDNKGFFTLPLKTAINSIYDRVSKGIIREKIDERVGLLHSDTYEQYLMIEKNGELEDNTDKIEEYYIKTKQLSLPLTICTLDQIFDFVFRYRGFEPKLATLSYSKIVIDEIQMYSPALLAYLLTGLKYIDEFGGKFAILTATLPGAILDLLKELRIDITVPERPFINDKIRHSINVIEKKIQTEKIIEKYSNNKVLIICNTVKEAQRVYGELKDRGVNELNMFHSKFIKKDRKKKESEILEIGDKKSKKSGIWIATQVVEASLDIDFDFLFTELSDLNGLFQRMGRCYRSRRLDRDYNCFLFIGEEREKCSGVGSFIDSDIHKLCREEIRKKDGILSEKDKIELIERVYSTENLKNTKYYKEIKSRIEYLNLIEDFEKAKDDIRDIFREMNTYSVIPLGIYNENREFIDECLKIIRTPYEKNMSLQDRERKKREKIKAKNNIRDLTLSVEEISLRKRISRSKVIELNDYERIYIVESLYTYELGFKLEENEKEIEKIEINGNNIF